MKHNRIEVVANRYTVLFKNNRTSKVRLRTYDAFTQWRYTNAPECDKMVTVPRGAEKVYSISIMEKWRKELKKYYSARCGNGVSVVDVQIDYEIVKNTPCAKLPLKECMEIMTPEQFFSEFGENFINIKEMD